MQKDNIADDTNDIHVGTGNISMEVDKAGESYMKLFEKLAASNDEVGDLVNQYHLQPHDEARIKLLMRIIIAQQKVNENTYALVVEMNNYFVP